MVRSIGAHKTEFVDDTNIESKEIRRLEKGDAIPNGWVRGKTGRIKSLKIQ